MLLIDFLPCVLGFKIRTFQEHKGGSLVLLALLTVTGCRES